MASMPPCSLRAVPSPGGQGAQEADFQDGKDWEPPIAQVQLGGPPTSPQGLLQHLCPPLSPETGKRLVAAVSCPRALGGQLLAAVRKLGFEV